MDAAVMRRRGGVSRLFGSRSFVRSFVCSFVRSFVVVEDEDVVAGRGRFRAISVIRAAGL